MDKQKKRINIDDIWAAFDREPGSKIAAMQIYYETHPEVFNLLESNQKTSSIWVRIAQSYLRLYNAFELMRLTNASSRALSKALVKPYGQCIGQAFMDSTIVITPHNGIRGTLTDLNKTRMFRVHYYELPTYEDFVHALLNQPEFEPGLVNTQTVS